VLKNSSNLISSQRNYEYYRNHLLQGGTQDGTRFCVRFFGINFPHRRICTNRKSGWHTFAAFALIATWSSTIRIPFASFRSWADTKWAGSTEAPWSVVLMYGSIVFVHASRGILNARWCQSDGLRRMEDSCKLWGAIPVLQSQRRCLGCCPFAPQSLLSILEQLPHLLVGKVLVGHVGEGCWAASLKEGSSGLEAFRENTRCRARQRI
jgi:hypothetical protein